MTLCAGPTGLSTERTCVGVIGGGAWGTSLAIHCARMGHTVLLWGLEKEVVEGINGAQRENIMFLPGHKCPEQLSATSNMADVVSSSELLLMVVPTPYIAATVAPVAKLLRPEQTLVSCTKDLHGSCAAIRLKTDPASTNLAMLLNKLWAEVAGSTTTTAAGAGEDHAVMVDLIQGILNDTLETPHEVLLRVLPRGFHGRLAYLSGPSFAVEVVKGLPTVVTIAAQEDAVASRVQALLSTPRFRCYRTTDVTGVELGGALKNVLAIACGISDGLDLGNNARAALITRGMNEITKLSVAKGGNPLTMNGLAGMGDLVLTCTGDLSRNRTVGLRLGRGETLASIIGSMHGAVAEGVLTSKSAHNLARKLRVECPIIEGIYKVIHEDADALAVVEEVMSRELKPELDYSVLAAPLHFS